jgi:hypothetical protein
MDERGFAPDEPEAKLDEVPTQPDGSACRVGKHLGERWEPTIHRLLTERHQRSVVNEGASGWRVE